MSDNLQALKSAVSFASLVEESHEISRSSKVLCPAHNDHTPSCHIYPDGAHCYACGWHADHITWLEVVHTLSTAEAIKELERRAGGSVLSSTLRRTVPSHSAPTFKPVGEECLKQHHDQASQFRHVPSCMEGRGFTLVDLQTLGFAAYGDDVVFPVPGPNGVVLALKRRYSMPYKGQRYRYVTPGHSTPAWCSPGLLNAREVLVVEGELNGMACYLAAPHLAVMGVAGTGGALHLEVLRGRTVYIYADGDEAGQKARDKWVKQALQAGATKVYALEPWPMDACDLAGKEGRAALRGWLT